MRADLAARFEEMEADRLDLFRQIEGLDPEQLRRAPEEGAWSVTQVVGHLILAESLTLGYMRKKIQDPSRLASSSWVHALKSRMLTLALRSPFRFTSPPSAAHPPNDRDLATLRHEWDETRREWREFVASCPPELEDKAIYRHPYAGPMTLERSLCFLEEHIRHHRRQIDRIVAEVA